MPSAAKTNAERQAAFRQRKATDQQATEVRGIFAHRDDAPAIKALAEKLQRKRARLAAKT
jgi:hypothetical protein